MEGPKPEAQNLSLLPPRLWSARFVRLFELAAEEAEDFLWLISWQIARDLRSRGAVAARAGLTLVFCSATHEASVPYGKRFSREVYSMGGSMQAVSERGPHNTTSTAS